MKIATLKEKIYQLANVGDEERDALRNTLAPMSEIALFIWLNDQDNGLRYHLAFDLDIPLQHLEHTCSTLKQIYHQPG